MKTLIIFLIRKYMGVRKGEYFKFNNQKSDSVYFFERDAIMKLTDRNCKKSNVALNWLLSNRCHITKI